jgi:hypothetical protein
MTFGFRCSQPAHRSHSASLPVRVPTVESLLSASFSFTLRLRLAFRYGCRHRLRLAPFIQRDSAHAGHTGADALVRAGPPGPALRAKDQVLTQPEKPARGPAADEGVRPTIYAGARLQENYVALTVRERRFSPLAFFAASEADGAVAPGQPSVSALSASPRLRGE